MEIREVLKEEYNSIVQTPFSKFDTVEFIELNKNKVDSVKYFIFNNGKDRFALTGGIKEGVLKFPFSASFSALTDLKSSAEISYYYEAIKVLIKWAKENEIKQIKFNTPPLYYGISQITKLQNALLNCGFRQSVFDVNFEYYLKNFGENYFETIQRNARKNYNTAFKNGVTFKKTDDISTAYEVIKINREQRGFPLWMSLEDVINTSKIIPTDCFLAKRNDDKVIASGIVHRFTDNIARVVYWGNLVEEEQLRPINLLSYNIFKYYKNEGFEIVDIGTSTVDSIANFGLCNFKESIGCDCSPKLNYILDMEA